MSFVTWLPNADGDWDTAADWSTGVLPTSNDQVTISTTSIHTISHSTGTDFALSLAVGNDIFNMTGGSLSIGDGASMATGFTMSGGSFTTGTTLMSSGGTFALSGGTLNVGSTLTVANSFSQTGGVLLAQSVVLNGPVQLLGGSLGGGTTLQATKTIILANYRIVGGAELLNTHTVDQTGAVTLGDASGVNATISNGAGATYNFANPTSINAGAATAQLVNAGTLAALAGTGTSTINVLATSTGSISIGAGSELAFDGALSTLGGLITGAGTIGLGGGTATIAAGTTIGTGAVALFNNNTTLALGGDVTVLGSFAQSNGSVLSLSGHTLTLMGAAQFTQSSLSPLVEGGTLVTDGATGIAGNNPGLVIASDAVWNNFGTVTETQSFQIGNTASSAATVTNEVGAVFDLAVNGDTIGNGSTPVSSFVNAGTLEMLAASGTTFVNVDLTSTGNVMVASGDNLQLNGPANTLAGSITGMGQLSFGGGTSTLKAGTAISVGTLALYNNATTLALGGNVTVSGSFSQSNGSVLSLGGHTLTLLGTAQFTQSSQTPLIAGGTLVTKGATSIIGNNPGLVVASGAAWNNYGTVTASQSFQVGNTASSAATVTNEAKAVFNLAVNGVAINNGSTPISSFLNHGTLESTAVGGSSSVGVSLVSTGTIKVASGANLILNGASNSLSGTVSVGSGSELFIGGTQNTFSSKTSGAGTLAFDGGSTTITAATIGSVAVVLFNNSTTLALGGNLAVSGSYTQNNGSVLSLGGFTLTVMGAAQFNQSSQTPLVAGGTLVTMGATSIAGNNPGLVIASGAVWDNYGTVTETQSFQIGNSASSAATVTNEAGAVFNLAVNGDTVGNGSTPASSFVNEGTLEMLASGGASVNVNLTSTGAINVVSGGNLFLNGGSNTVVGNISIGTGGELVLQGVLSSLNGVVGGAGTLGLGGGTTTIAAETIGTGAVALFGNGTTLALGGNVTVSGSYTQSNGSVLSLGGYTLTLLGAAQFNQSSETPLVAGGTLVTDGATGIAGNNPGLVVASGAVWNNFGTVTETQSFQIGNTASSAATVTNEAGAVFDLAVNGDTIGNGSTPVSSFVSAGTLEMQAAGGGASINVNLASTGAVTVAAGDNLQLNGPANSLAGSITGAGQLSFGAGTSTLAGGTAINVGTLALYNNATTLALGGNVTVTGSFTQSNGSVLSLGGHTLTLMGAAQFTQSSSSPLIAGGTLVTGGFTSILGGNPGLVIASGAAWTNSGTVVASQSITVGNSSSAAATVTNTAKGVFDLAVNGIAINNGSTPVSSFINAGTLEMTAINGSGSVGVSVSNSGTVLAQNGQLSLTGAVTGTGALDIGTSGTLSFTSTVQSTETLKFLDDTGMLRLTLPTPSSFAAEITNFAQGDTIDLTNVTNATGTFSGGVLTFTDSTSHATVAVLNFTGSPTFAYASDGHGGTLITDPSAAAAIPRTASVGYFGDGTGAYAARSDGAFPGERAPVPENYPALGRFAGIAIVALGNSFIDMVHAENGQSTWSAHVDGSERGPPSTSFMTSNFIEVNCGSAPGMNSGWMAVHIS